MKTFNIFFCFGIFLFVLVWFSCKKTNVKEEEDVSCDIVMTDGKIQKPKWLKSIADSISDIYAPLFVDYPQYGDYVPLTFTVKHLEEDFILVRDGLNRNSMLGYLFVSCSGKKVVSGSELWMELMNEILPCDIALEKDRIQSPQWLVQAIDSVANLYTPRGVHKPLVYCLPYQKQEYIFLNSLVAPTILKGQIFFTCFGEKIEPDSDLWWELENERSKKYDQILLIWMI